MVKYNLLAVVGPTASGKTLVGTHLARYLSGEIISADSRQVFRRMDIGTGKDLAEYGEVPYHGIDVVEPGEPFSVFDFQRLGYQAITTIRSQGKLPILVGGTGLYLEAILLQYRLVTVPENQALRLELAALRHRALVERLHQSRPTLHNTTDLRNRDVLLRAIEIAEGETSEQEKMAAPPEIVPYVLGIQWPRDILRGRITRRLQARLEAGLIAEVEGLVKSGVSHETLSAYGLEYRFVSKFLQNVIDWDTMFQQLNHGIHQFAKRQDTWFRRMERKGITIHWLPGGPEMGQQASMLVHHVAFDLCG